MSDSNWSSDEEWEQVCLSLASTVPTEVISSTPILSEVTSKTSNPSEETTATHETAEFTTDTPVPSEATTDNMTPSEVATATHESSGVTADITVPSEATAEPLTPEKTAATNESSGNITDTPLPSEDTTEILTSEETTATHESSGVKTDLQVPSEATIETLAVSEETTASNESSGFKTDAAVPSEVTVEILTQLEVTTATYEQTGVTTDAPVHSDATTEIIMQSEVTDAPHELSGVTTDIHVPPESTTEILTQSEETTATHESDGVTTDAPVLTEVTTEVQAYSEETTATHESSKVTKDASLCTKVTTEILTQSEYTTAIHESAWATTDAPVPTEATTEVQTQSEETTATHESSGVTTDAPVPTEATTEDQTQSEETTATHESDGVTTDAPVPIEATTEVQTQSEETTATHESDGATTDAPVPTEVTTEVQTQSEETTATHESSGVTTDASLRTEVTREILTQSEDTTAIHESAGATTDAPVPTEATTEVQTQSEEITVTHESSGVTTDAAEETIGTPESSEITGEKTASAKHILEQPGQKTKRGKRYKESKILKENAKTSEMFTETCVPSKVTTDKPASVKPLLELPSQSSKYKKHSRKSKMSGKNVKDHRVSPHDSLLNEVKSPQKNSNSVKQKQAEDKVQRLDDESSDDDITVTNFEWFKGPSKEMMELGLDSTYDSGDSFKPSKDDYDSSDSNLSTPTDDSSTKFQNLLKDKVKNKRKKKQKVPCEKKSKNTTSIHRSNTREKSIPSKEVLQDKRPIPLQDEDLNKAKDISMQETAFNKLSHVHHEKRLDDLLFANGLERKYVPSDGNCFFQSALFSLNLGINSTQTLRRAICEHIIENPNEYLAFFAVSEMSESFDEDIAWIDFRTEIDALLTDGFWTNRAADLLPLALANWSGRIVKIFSGRNQNILDVVPTLNPNPSKEYINLAYLASESNTIPEHYDACVNLGLAPVAPPCTINTEDPKVTGHQEESQSTTCCNDVQENESTPAADTCKLSGAPDIMYYCEPLTTPEKTRKKRGRPKGTPPRKAPNFITPPKKKLFRKRKATPDTWKRNVRKTLRLSGKEYTSVKGNVVKEKTMRQKDCARCTFKCSQTINEEQRQKIFNTFWSLDSNERKKDFIIFNTQQKKTRTYVDDENTPVAKKRHVHRSYSLNVDDMPINVCKKFFLATLGISETYAMQAMH